jgi:PAS domain-containing protein
MDNFNGTAEPFCPPRAFSSCCIGGGDCFLDGQYASKHPEALRIGTSARLPYSERRFRLLVEGVTDYAIYMLDPDGTVTNWNAGAQRIKGYAPDEIVGQHFSIFIPRTSRLPAGPQKPSRPRCGKENLRPKAGASEKTARVSSRRW